MRSISRRFAAAGVALVGAAALSAVSATAQKPAAAAKAAALKTRFEVSFPPTAISTPVTGRVFVMISRVNDREPRLQIGRTGVPFFGRDVEPRLGDFLVAFARLERLVLQLVVALARSRHRRTSRAPSTRERGARTTRSPAPPVFFDARARKTRAPSRASWPGAHTTVSIRRIPLRVTTMRTRCQGASTSSARRSRYTTPRLYTRGASAEPI